MQALITLDEVGRERDLDYEIVVVNDGSCDGTLGKAIQYANQNCKVKVISYSTNVGKGHAVKRGFLKATGDIVIFADSDLDIDLSQVSVYVDALKDGDIVIGSKWHPDSAVDIPLSRRILSHGFNVLVRILIGAKVKDTQVGFKAMRKSAFLDVFPRLSVKRYAFDVELLAIANLRDLRVVEMPVKLKIENHFNFKDLWRMLEDLLGIAYRLRVLHWYEREISDA